MKTSNTFQKFNILIILIIFIFIIINLLYWISFTQYSWKGERGDLSRIGYIYIDKYPICSTQLNSDKSVVDFSDYLNNPSSVDIIIFGDSFSQAYGINSYQNHIINNTNYSIVNIKPYKAYNSFDTFTIFYNSGLIDEIKPKYVIIEQVERVCEYTFLEPKNIALNETREEILKQYSDREIQFPISINSLPGSQLNRVTINNDSPNNSQSSNTKISSILFNLTQTGLSFPPYINFIKNKTNDRNNPQIDVILGENLNYFENFFSYAIFQHSVDKKVYKFRLSKPMFSSVTDDKTLLVYCEDIDNLNKSGETGIVNLNTYLNFMSQKLKERNIKLYFMPVVNKYNLHYNFIENNPYPPSNFFEKLRKTDKDYTFIDTKEILINHVDNGEIDLWSVGDTHWIWPSPEYVADSINFTQT